jgi:hypothetical protein
MASRLDRLINLIETGSTPATRKAAALQIGLALLYFILNRQEKYRSYSPRNFKISFGAFTAPFAVKTGKHEQQQRKL